MMPDGGGATSSIDALLVRLALLRQAIDRRFVRLPLGTQPATGEYRCSILNSSTCAEWDHEEVLVYDRGEQCWAVQAACPHAGISLATSDIEDFPTMLDAPCIACPAHMYVFELGHGTCLTNRTTPDARTYLAVAWRDRGIVWVARSPMVQLHRPAHNITDPEKCRQVGNAIQLALVDKGLRRRFGDTQDGESGPG